MIANITATTDPAAPRVLKESPQRWWLATLLFVGMSLVYAQRGALSVAATFISREYHLNPAVTGLLLSAFFWSYAFMQVPSGFLVDRLGIRRVYAAGMVLSAVASALMGVAGGLASLLLFRILLGLGQAVSFPASSGAVATSFPDRERGTVTATYLCGVRLGQAAVVGLGGLFIPLYGWKVLFVLVGVASLTWVLPWSAFVKKWEQPAEGKTARLSAKPQPGFLDSLAVLRHRSVLGTVLGFFAYDYAWFLYTAWLPAYLTTERHFTPAEMATLGSVPYLFMSVAILLSGLFSDWLIRAGRNEIAVRKGCITVGMLIACCIVPAGLVPDKFQSVLLITISMCGLGIAAPNCWTITQAVCSKRIVGTVSGMQNLGGNIGGILAPTVTGYIAYVTHSFALALSLTGGVLIFGTLAYLLLIGPLVDE